MKRRFGMIILILITIPFTSFAQFSLGTEFGLLGTAGLSVGFEKEWFRSELVGHLFALDYVTALFTEDGFHDIHKNPIIGKAIVSAKFTPWERHALYAGVGLIGYFDLYEYQYMLGLGPAVQYVWKFPEKRFELNFDVLVPLAFKHNYEIIADDDWPSTASFVFIELIVMAPTLGISWSF